MSNSSKNSIDIEYNANLSLRVKTVLNKKELDFIGIVKRCKGAYPLDVKNVIDALIDRREIYRTPKNKFTRQVQIPELFPYSVPVKYFSQNFKIDLSDPHPLDYDWRFTKQTIEDVCENILRLTTKDDRILLFGATTLFPVLRSINTNTILINRNSILLNDLKSILNSDSGLLNHDLFYPLPNELVGKAQLVMADPPWYIDFYKAFILRAAESLNIGGYLLLSVLPEFTNPTALKDQIEIIRFSNFCGLELQTAHDPYKLKYDIPIFEKKSLELNHIHIPEWRMGKLFVFKKNTATNLDIELTIPNEGIWDEYKIGNKSIKIKKIESILSEKLVISQVDFNPTLGTVSRRYEKRHKINFWTSDNLAYNINRLDIVSAIILDLIKKDDVSEAVQKAKIRFDIDDETILILTDLFKMALA